MEDTVCLMSAVVAMDAYPRQEIAAVMEGTAHLRFSASNLSLMGGSFVVLMNHARSISQTMIPL